MTRRRAASSAIGASSGDAATFLAREGASQVRTQGASIPKGIGATEDTDWRRSSRARDMGRHCLKGHLLRRFGGLVLRGHFVIVTGVVTKARSSRCVPVTHDVATGSEEVETEPL